MKEDIVFFIGNINYIGGVETWIYEIAKIYGKKRNIVMMYNWIAPKQLYRLRRLVKCIKYTGQRIECNKMIFAYDFSALKTTTAKEFIYTIHADYKFQKIKVTIPPQTTKIYAVSQTARDSFYETHKEQIDNMGLTVEVLYNPIEVEKPKRVLKLISPTRLTKEKGGNRMVAMAKRLKEREIPFIWLVYSTDNIGFDVSNFVMMQPELDIRDYIADADYLVQLSDTEGYAYSLVEAMCLGTPVLVTDLPILKEMKIKDGENAFVLDFDLSNLDEVIDKAYNNNLKGFKYVKNHSNKEYLKILGEETIKEYNYKEDGYEALVLKPSTYVEEDMKCVKGDIIVCKTLERLEYLERLGYVKPL